MAKVVAHSYAQYYSNLRTSISLGYSPKKTKKKKSKPSLLKAKITERLLQESELSSSETKMGVNLQTQSELIEKYSRSLA